MATQIITPLQLFVSPSVIEVTLSRGFDPSELNCHNLKDMAFLREQVKTLIEKSILNLNHAFSGEPLVENENEGESENENNNTILFN